ncbi:SDR family NAD(P)-dependent oxidoreductase [Pandoraea pulmonicola]|uniref:General stress protein 39 n=1 Tax=Pandoraea pulmonicola TaxID=93221 RepID=A0AAJ4Z8W6_PANPU|nr:glucose 1-dehydrogenase [Pandoraea pulmonicola]AJC22084.1 oxidoreductase [Pandoraea pulmonicola]SUA88917.1 General stress protein 39 [Pandoraea pulmonicola]
MQDLKGKFVLITGASTGIGAAAAKAFAAQGANVAIHYNRSARQAETVAEAVRAHGVQAMTVAADAADSDAVNTAVAQVLDGFGRIDVLINNAGSLVKRTPFAEVTDAYFDEVLNVNARSVVAFSRAVVPAMRKQGGGAIVNVTSIAARHGGGPGALIYAAAKGFVSTLTRGMAKELMPDRIRVNAVSPGVIMTPFHEQFSTQAQIDAFRQSIPMGRLGEPDECSGAFLYLASETLASYVTGQIIEVNGGQLMV